MGTVKWSYETLDHFCHDVFCRFGFSEEESGIIKSVLLLADLYGIESHGMQRMVRYHKGIEKGTIHVDAKPEVVFETPVSAVIEVNNGLGMLFWFFAIKKTNLKTKHDGDRHGNSQGIQSFWNCRILCENGLRPGTAWNGVHEF